MHKTLTMRHVEGKPGAVYYPLQLLPTPTPAASSKQLLLRPTHVSLNHRDLFCRQALYPSPSFTTPLLSDACCVVLNPSVSPLALSASATPDASSTPNRRVIVNPGHGWLSAPEGPEDKYAIMGGTKSNLLGVAQEVFVVDEAETFPCPEHLSGAEAAALPLCGLTAWRALVTKSGAASKDKTILIPGIGGGVALMVLLFAVKMGINVYVTSSTSTKLEKAKHLGAKGGVLYRDSDWERQLLAMLPGSTPKFDSIIDGAGGDIVKKATKLLKHGGTIVTYGMTIAPTLPVPMAFVMANLELRGTMMGSRAEFSEMVAFVAQHQLHPPVSKIVKTSWVEGPKGIVAVIEELFEDMKAGRQFGKLVLEVVAEGENEGEKSRL